MASANPPDLGERTRAVWQAGVVAQIDDVLVRQRHEQLVEDREAAHAGVEHADRPPVHRADDTGVIRRHGPFTFLGYPSPP